MTSSFALPSSVLSNILSQWCNVKDLVNFDSASCNFKNREIYLNVTQLPAFILSQRFSVDGIIWAAMRKINLQSITLIGSDLSLIPEDLNLSKIISISFNDIDCVENYAL